MISIEKWFRKQLNEFGVTNTSPKPLTIFEFTEALYVPLRHPKEPYDAPKEFWMNDVDLYQHHFYPCNIPGNYSRRIKEDFVDNYWFYRTWFKEPTVNDIKERISLNVTPNLYLINEMDQIMLDDNGEHMIMYKFPSNPIRWLSRYDPMTIYLRSASKNIVNRIVNEAKPHARQQDNKTLVGTKMAPGVTLCTEFIGKAFNEFYKRAEQIFKPVAEVIGNRASISAGHGHIYNMLLITIQNQEISKESLDLYTKWDRGDIKTDTYTKEIKLL